MIPSLKKKSHKNLYIVMNEIVIRTGLNTCLHIIFVFVERNPFFFMLQKIINDVNQELFCNLVTYNKYKKSKRINELIVKKTIELAL
jgi:hypothetical protein